MNTEPSEHPDDLPISEHAPTLEYLDQTRLEDRVLVSRYDTEKGKVRDFIVTVEETST